MSRSPRSQLGAVLAALSAAVGLTLLVVAGLALWAPPPWLDAGVALGEPRLRAAIALGFALAFLASWLAVRPRPAEPRRVARSAAQARAEPARERSYLR